MLLGKDIKENKYKKAKEGDKSMYEHKILVDKELNDALINISKEKNMTVSEFIAQILNKYLALMHNINQEEMAKGYEEMGEINIELSK